mmetsp:Transcript_43280/g.116362  ORF Transcript_43280/g.116362 Transcript_43280/m.116362 type:complete len:128 (-) Transcript_43280:69-452(-)
MGMLRVPLVIFFLATAWAQELSRQELGPALAADDECAADDGGPCGVELLQARASKGAQAEQTASTVEMTREGGEQLLQHDASANATVNSSQTPACKATNSECWIDSECCSGRCGLGAVAARRCASVR